MRQLWRHFNIITLINQFIGRAKVQERRIAAFGHIAHIDQL